MGLQLPAELLKHSSTQDLKVDIIHGMLERNDIDVERALELWEDDPDELSVKLRRRGMTIVYELDLEADLEAARSASLARRK